MGIEPTTYQIVAEMLKAVIGRILDPQRVGFPIGGALVSLPALRRGIGSSPDDGGRRTSYVHGSQDDEMRSGSG